MNREEILEALKESVISLKDDQEKFRSEPDFLAAWQKRQQATGIESKKLSAEDKAWMEAEYNTWFQAEILPVIDPSLLP